MIRKIPIVREEYDIVVVGGGLAGVCAAVAAARAGKKTVLIQNRPVLGGNSSAEIGVPPHGADQNGSYRHVRETGIIDEIATANAHFPNHIDSPSIWSTVLWAFCRGEANLTVHLNAHAGEVAMDGDRVTSVSVEQQTTEKRFEISGKIFIDCSGDGVIGYRSGAEFMTGRESRDRFGESMAQEKADEYRMGNSVYIRARDVGHPVPFPSPSWVHRILSDDDLPDKGTTCPHPVEELAKPRGGWWWIETGGMLDTISDAETIRDELYRYAIGVWDHVKNHGEHGADNYVLESIVTMPGKRESRRFIGDYVMVESDVRSGRIFDDAIAYGGWHVDVHKPEGISGKMYWYGKLLNGVFTIPYRSLYSRNIANLFFAGRTISASHVAFGSTRVMLTCAIMGQAAGSAAVLCLRHGCAPRDIHALHLEELQQELLKQDCYLPGVRDRTEGNLALRASIRASSSQVLDAAKVEDYHPLDAALGQMFVHSGRRLNKISLPLENKTSQAIEVTAYLRAARRIDDFTSKEDLKRVVARVPSGRSLVDFHFDMELPEPDRPYWIQLPAMPGIGWGHSHREEPGCQAARLKEQFFTEPGTEMLMHRERGTYAFQLDPVSACYGPDQVVSGVTRPEQSANLWIAGGEGEQWLELSWEKPVSISEVHLTFDNDLDRKLSVWSCQGPAGFLARDYVVSILGDGAEVHAERVEDNIQRKRVHRFQAVRASSIRINIGKTWGDQAARVFEVRAY